MKTQLLRTLGIFALLTATASLHAADTIRLDSAPGSKVRIAGTASAIHTSWLIEGKVIGGYMEVGSDFPVAPGQTAKPGPMKATVEAFIPVRGLKSIEEDGSHYSDSMDDKAYEKLHEQVHRRITYHLTEMVLKESPKAAGQPYLFDTKGELTVSGKTNKVSFPVQITPVAEKKLKVIGSTALKMTDFGVDPPTLIGILSTGDEVKITFEWNVAEKPQEKPAASPATK